MISEGDGRPSLTQSLAEVKVKVRKTEDEKVPDIVERYSLGNRH
jgi:hypothetical protein